MINQELKEDLKEIIDSRGECRANKDFLIQYSIFEFNGDEWYMNCTLAKCKNEGIYDIDVEYTNNETTVIFKSWKGNYDDFTHAHCEDHCDSSTPNRVYACDVYDDFEPKNFVGECYTRGGFTGWNWTKI